MEILLCNSVCRSSWLWRRQTGLWELVATKNLSQLPFKCSLQMYSDFPDPNRKPALRLQKQLWTSQVFQKPNQVKQVKQINHSHNPHPWHLLMDMHGSFPSVLTGLISLQSKKLSRVFSNTIVQKHQFFRSACFMVQLSHPYMTTGKNIALTRRILVTK